MGESDRLRRLLDEWEIARLGKRYAGVADDHDLEVLVGCFLDDGALVFPATAAVGRTQIRSVIEALWTKSRASQHATTNFLVSVDGDTAAMRSDVIVTHSSFAKPDELWVVGAAYRDALVRWDGEWLFRKRTIDPIWSVGDASLFECRSVG